jgi:glycosyltransferase involved in cell wall biosynthesis
VRVLFLHNNFPAQFRHIARALGADRANQVLFGTSRTDGPQLEGVVRAHYEASRPATADGHPYLRATERAVLVGQGVVRMADELRRKRFRPDVVVAHSGWGPAMFVKEVFPQARLLLWLEWFHRAAGANNGFLPEEPMTPDITLRVRASNVPFLLDLVEADWSVCPTEYQASQIPLRFRRRLSVLHEGVDTSYFQPQRIAPEALRIGGLRLPPGAELLTYATRGMEPYRGFPQFLRAAELLVAGRPNLHVVIAGRDEVVYGRPLPPGASWRAKLSAELDLPPERVHFVGELPYVEYRQLLQASHVHVYLTIPFVLSWSLLEAMACGALVVGSDTEPVQEVIEHERNGVLVPFFDHEHLAARIHHALENPAAYQPLRARARTTIVERYDLATLLPRHQELISQLAAASGR